MLDYTLDYIYFNKVFHKKRVVESVNVIYIPLHTSNLICLNNAINSNKFILFLV